jgi:hypothetical protein
LPDFSDGKKYTKMISKIPNGRKVYLNGPKLPNGFEIYHFFTFFTFGMQISGNPIVSPFLSCVVIYIPVCNVTGYFRPGMSSEAAGFKFSMEVLLEHSWVCLARWVQEPILRLLNVQL